MVRVRSEWVTSVVVVVWFGDPCESPGALLLTAAPVTSVAVTSHFTYPSADVMEVFYEYQKRSSIQPVTTT